MILMYFILTYCVICVMGSFVNDQRRLQNISIADSRGLFSKTLTHRFHHLSLLNDNNFL